MRNGPVLWHEILQTVRNIGGINPIIAGGAVRDYVLKLGEPKDIDVFIGGEPPDEMQLPEGDWLALIPDREDPNNPVQAEYHGQMGTITALQNWRCEMTPRPVQFIWIGDNDPVQYVRGFDLGTSKCYYRGSVVLGKDFLHDWHHQQITILPVAFEHPRNVERSRERARLLRGRYPNGATIVELGAQGALAVPVPVMDDMLHVLNINPLPINNGWVMRNAAGEIMGLEALQNPGPLAAMAQMQNPGNAVENAPAQPDVQQQLAEDAHLNRWWAEHMAVNRNPQAGGPFAGAAVGRRIDPILAEPVGQDMMQQQGNAVPNAMNQPVFAQEAENNLQRRWDAHQANVRRGFRPE